MADEKIIFSISGFSWINIKSVKTTEAYIHRQKDPNQSGTAILTAEYDYSKLDSLSKEQLLMLIHEKPEIENMIFSSAIRHKVL